MWTNDISKVCEIRAMIKPAEYPWELGSMFAVSEWKGPRPVCMARGPRAKGVSDVQVRA